MAGEWLKMEACTPEKSEVLAITAKMGWDDTDLTVGKLFRIWRWFDQQTTDGNACGVTTALLDRIVGVAGFCSAMLSVGWLAITDDGISLPNFDRHNGNTAKNRAQTAKRVATHKAIAKANAQGNAGSVSDALPREEKRRDTSTTGVVDEKPAARTRPAVRPEGVSESVWADFQAIRKAKRAPLTQTALDGIQREASKAGMGLADVLALCCARGWQGFKADWVAGQKPGVVMPQSKAARQAADQAWVDELMDRKPANVIDITDAQIVGGAA